jgi:penicillin-binding protein 2
MKRIIALGTAFFLAAFALVFRLSDIMTVNIPVSTGGGRYTLYSDEIYGNIYDRNMVSFTNTEAVYEAVVNPNSPDTTKVLPYIIDHAAFTEKMKQNRPFLAKITAAGAKNPSLIVFKTYNRTAEFGSAPHIIGYTSDGAGAAGIERAYNTFLRGETAERAKSSITFSVDALGSVLNGLESTEREAAEVKSGVVLTLDSRVQTIAEQAAVHCGLEKGAIVVMETDGDILASASFPTFNAARVEDYLNAPNSPLYNRAFAPSAVGSIFKLTTAAEALEEGITPEYTYNCRGSIRIADNLFGCHSWAGHGVINIHGAIVYSCNPFFIALGSDISLSRYRERLVSFGFGEAVTLAPGLTANGCNLPTITELKDSVERANIAFGQGKLTASPLQICRFTAAIAANGALPEPRLVYGIISPDGKLSETETAVPANVMSDGTAAFLREAMRDTILTSVQSAIPTGTTAGGKTSTAQTGIFKEDGSEQVQVWFTGFFPYENPRYAVTVLVEDGVSGTLTAAPVFAEIASEMVKIMG